VTWGNLSEEEEELMNVNLYEFIMYPEEVLRHRSTKEGVATREAWLKNVFGGWICFKFLNSQMDCNFISKSAVVFFQISLRGVKSHIDMVPWCHNGVCSKRLRLFNESEGMVDGSVILLTS